MTPKQTDSELREEVAQKCEDEFLSECQSSDFGTLYFDEIEHYRKTLRNALHQREQQIYAELMEKIEKEQSKYTEILDNSFWINQGIASVKTIINNIFKHE